MAVNGMSVGRDFSFVIYNPATGTIVDLGDVQSVKVTPMFHDVRSSPYNGQPKFGVIPDGYRLSFSITRTGGELENFQLAMNKRFNDGLSIAAAFINETVTNPDGTVNEYQYVGVSLKVSDIGDISREKTVTMAVEAMASDKVQLQ